MTVEEFIRKWRGQHANENSAYQENFRNLCALLDVQPPMMDEDYKYQKSAPKIGLKGNDYADVFKRDCFIVEYKSRGNLGAAIAQVQKYQRSLGNPPLLLAINWENINISASFTSTDTAVYSYVIEDLRDPAIRARLRAMFDPTTIGDAWNGSKTRKELTEDVAVKIRILATDLYSQEIDKSEASTFLIQLIFALFSSDPFIGLLDENILRKILKRAKNKSSNFPKDIKNLFEQMSQDEGSWGGEDVRYFNGKLYEKPYAFELSQESLDHLTDMLDYRWANLEPSIFGSVFENGLKADDRRKQGINYTGVDQIQALVDPVIIDDARDRMEITLATCRTADETGRSTAIDEFKDWLSHVRVLDPACGSGNFLYVAHRNLRTLEKHFDDILFNEYGIEGLPTAVGVHNVSGIEKQEFAAKLASIATWIGDIQWHLLNYGSYSRKPVLPNIENIIAGDSLLGESEVDRLWGEATHVVGNPPYLGGNRIRSQLGADYRSKLLEKYPHVKGNADLACFFIDRAESLLRNGDIQRLGFVVKSSLPAQEGSVKTLKRIAEKSEIFYALTKQKWHDDSISIQVSLFAAREKADSSKSCILDNRQVSTITPMLMDGEEFFAKLPIRKSMVEACEGMKPNGKGFMLTLAEAKAMLSEVPTLESSPSVEVIKAYAGREMFAFWGKAQYVIDFGGKKDEEAQKFDTPYQRLMQTVKLQREISNAASPTPIKTDFVDRNTQFQKTRPKIVRFLRDHDRMIVTPITNDQRVFGFITKGTIPSDSLLAIMADDWLTLGILQSKVQEIWATHQIRVERYKNKRYRKTACYDTFPYPENMYLGNPTRETGELAQDISDAAEKIVKLRDEYMYPPKYVKFVPVIEDPEVAKALPAIPVFKDGVGKTEQKDIKARTLNSLHPAANQKGAKVPVVYATQMKKLDDAVLKAYGLKPDATDSEIMDRLIWLYNDFRLA